MHSASRKHAFDRVAKLYHEARPGYPDELIDDVISLSGIATGGRILEIGCGTGQATVPFARRGYSMLCLEPGHNLATLARENLREYPAVEVRVVSFEDWPLEEAAYDLVVSANAFHWIPAEIGYPKAAQALRPSGAIALFRNADRYAESEFLRQLQSAYQRHAPQLALGAPKARSEDSADRKAQEIDAVGLFEEVTVRHYPWSVEYDAEAYLRLLGTYSDHLALPAPARQSLYEAIGRLIDAHGGAFTKAYDAVLHLARKRAADDTPHP